jgi:excinuclease ABC subunit C
MVNNKKSRIEQKLKAISTQPGVYLFKNPNNRVIYIGKAKNIRNRVRSYFHSRPYHNRTEVMVRQVSDIETILVDSEIEALFLEATLIKKYKPRYNVNLRDDKSYPYIRITNEPFPQVFVTRRRVNDGSKYLGPYTDVKHLRFIIKSLRKIFPIRSCKFYLDDKIIEARKVKLCLDYHIHKCQGPCEGLISQVEYNQMIDHVEKFLKGKTKELVAELKDRMEKKSDILNFEEAARLRDQIKMIENYYFNAQKVILNDSIDRDVISTAIEDEDACAVLFKIRDGKVINRQHFYLKGVGKKNPNEILSEFLKQYYIATDFYPEQILLPFPINDDKELIEEWLTESAHHKVEITIPQIGEKKRLVDLGQKNARYLLDDLLLQKIKNKDYVAYNVRELQKALMLETPPQKIEGFDISNIQGKDAVASMVCFINGRPKKSEYRHFNIRSKQTPDDFTMIREVVYRRYKRLLNEKKPFPDLILIDGGKGQLSSALEALSELGVKNQPIIGLAKRLEEVFLPEKSGPINIPKRNSGLRLLQQIRDETHRFAITHFRKRHQKSTITSTLDEVKGIGPKRKKHLLKTFGSLRKIKELTFEELSEKGNLPKDVAQNVIMALKK